jgi:hypothetical protein
MSVSSIIAIAIVAGIVIGVGLAQIWYDVQDDWDKD